MSVSAAAPAISNDGGVQDLPGLILRLSMARGLEDVMAAVRRGVRQLLGADGATFVLREGDLCFYADEDAIGPLWQGQRFPMSLCISGWAMFNGGPAAIPDIYKDPRIPADAYRPTFVRSLIMMPVGRDGEAPAAIGAYWRTVRSFSDAEIALLGTVAEAASVAMANVSHYRTLAAAAEQATRRAEAAERANIAKGRFLAALSHDLRQPLLVMRLLQSVLQRQLSDASALAILSKLDGATTTAEDLLNRTLTVSALDGGGIRPVPEDFAISEMLSELVAEHQFWAESRGLRLRLVCSGTLRVHSDRVQLARIVRNLVENALNYTQRGGVLVGCRRQAGGARIEVWDTGIGIAQDQQEAIFEEFYRVGGEGGEGGMGLGLAIVAKTCRLLGHGVTIRSRPGHGSVFVITLPEVPPP